jgi:hypothetical protein
LIFVLLPGLVINLICFSLSPARHIFFLYLAQHLRRRVSKKDGCQIDFSTPKSESAHPPVANKSAGTVCVCELRENAQTQCGKSTLQKLLKNKQLSDAKLFPRAVSLILMAGVQCVSARERGGTHSLSFLFSLSHTNAHTREFVCRPRRKEFISDRAKCCRPDL